MPRTVPRIDLWITLALVVSTLALYLPVRNFDFVNYDDPDFITHNPHVRHGLTVDNIVWAFTSTENANWFPVTRLSELVDGDLFGLNSGGHHLDSALIHAWATALLFAFLHLATGARWPSAFVALIFGWHPVHVESVAWVAERKDVLCALFWFLSLWAWVRYTRGPSRGRYLLALAGFVLGLMSKPMIVTLPFVLLLLDFWPLRRARALREKIPFFVLSAGACVVTVVAQRGSGAVEGLSRVPFGLRAANAAVSYLVYLGKAVWPERLAVFYPYPADLPVWQTALSALALVLTSVVVVGLFWRCPYLAVGWFWFLGTLVPVNGLVQVGSQARADRYLYVPLVGLTMMAAWGAADLAAKRPATKSAIAVMGAVLAIACAPLTWAQEAHWTNSESLFSHALAVTTANSLAEHNLGSYLLDVPGRLPDALSHLQAAAHITPDSASIHSDLGTALAKSGRFAEAIAEYRQALRLNPDSAIVHNNLGNALRESGHRPEATAEYQQALRIDPEYADARQNLAAPESAAAHDSAGIELSHAGRLEEAAAQFEAALRLQPDDAEAENNLGVALTQIPARQAEALSHFEKAVRLKPDYADAHYNLGVALSQLPGRMPEAIAQLEAAYRLRPDPDLRRALERLRSGR